MSKSPEIRQGWDFVEWGSPANPTPEPAPKGRYWDGGEYEIPVRRPEMTIPDLDVANRAALGLSFTAEDLRALRAAVEHAPNPTLQPGTRFLDEPAPWLPEKFNVEGGQQ